MPAPTLSCAAWPVSPLPERAGSAHVLPAATTAGRAGGGGVCRGHASWSLSPPSQEVGAGGCQGHAPGKLPLRQLYFNDTGRLRL